MGGREIELKKYGIMDKKKGKNETNRNSSNIKNKWENKAISSKIATTTKSTKNVILYVCVLTLIDFWISSRSMCLWEYADAGIDP